MNKFLVSLFILSFASHSFAAEKVSCFKLASPYDQKYSLVKVLWKGDIVEKVKVSLVNSNEFLEDQNLEVSSRRIEPVCHGTLSGRYLCTPWSTVTLYKNFQKNIIKSLYFDFATAGMIELKDEAEAIRLKDVSCF